MTIVMDWWFVLLSSRVHKSKGHRGIDCYIPRIHVLSALPQKKFFNININAFVPSKNNKNKNTNKETWESTMKCNKLRS